MLRSALAAALALGTLIVYAPVLDFEFVNYDDPSYVTDNPQVLRGLSLDAVVWAFTGRHQANWHPISSLSHLIDVECFGLEAGGHHATSLLLHVVNTLLLFWLLVACTGRALPAAVVAALFAWHPLHVESVAWVSERKDVLSTAFGLGALLAYQAYARLGGARRYAWVVVLFALGLMSKPMLVTLPALMLLFDLWPLGRWSWADERRWSVLGRLVLEKLPLLALSLVTTVLTLGAQRAVGATDPNAWLPLWIRVCNALVSCVAYLANTLWPVSLGPMVPHPFFPGGTPLESFEVAGSAALLAGISALAVREFLRGRPIALVGWLWYLIGLLPVIGLVQLGDTALADRYTYVPLVGPFFVVAFLGADVLRERGRVTRAGVGCVVVVLLLALAVAARQQLGIWRDSLSLTQHVVDAIARSPKTLNQRGMALEEAGRIGEAAAAYREALSIDATYSTAHNNLANLLLGAGRRQQAVRHYRTALQHEPDFADAHYNLGVVLLRQGRVEIGIEHLSEAARLDPGVVEYHLNLGISLAASGDAERASAELEAALALDPGNATAIDWLQRVRGR